MEIPHLGLACTVCVGSICVIECVPKASSRVDPPFVSEGEFQEGAMIKPNAPEGRHSAEAKNKAYKSA